MKSLTISVIAITTVFGGVSCSRPKAVVEPARSTVEPARSLIEGTWEHTFEDQPNIRQIKVINQDHFIWVTSDRESKKSLYSAGGPYTFKGNTYKEQHEFGTFGSPEWQQLVGHEQVFTVEIKGDTLFLSGTASNGMELFETWKRLK